MIEVAIDRQAIALRGKRLEYFPVAGSGSIKVLKTLPLPRRIGNWESLEKCEIKLLNDSVGLFVRNLSSQEGHAEGRWRNVN